MVVPFLESSAQTPGIPQNLNQLWEGYDPHKDPLEIEVLKEWELDGVVCRIVRYQVGVFKGAPARVAAFYAFPKMAPPWQLQWRGGNGGG